MDMAEKLGNLKLSVMGVSKVGRGKYYMEREVGERRRRRRLMGGLK
jgi:hypothetical protein